jgi:hypothetical protein
LSWHGSEGLVHNSGLADGCSGGIQIGNALLVTLIESVQRVPRSAAVISFSTVSGG